MLTHQSLISEYDKPRHFRYVMLRGAFQTFEHDHFFDEMKGGTLMRDRLQFAAPLGLLGLAAERLVLRAYLLWFLKERNEHIRHVAESQQSVWSRYIDAR